MFTHFTHKGRQTPYFVVYYEFNEDMTVKEKKKNETKKMIGEIAILLILMGLPVLPTVVIVIVLVPLLITIFLQ